MQTQYLATMQLNRDRLVAEIKEHLEHPLKHNVLEAFSAIPRHIFVDSYYEQQGNRLVWKRVIAPPLESIYIDEALVTSVDKRGFPASSSSQPSVMAAQLDELDLFPGQNILEIGTGTGYNAALIEWLVRPNGRVVSIDIDEEYVKSARLHLQQCGCNNVLTMIGDGRFGEWTYAPYDAILATCGVRCIPFAWLQQVRQHGVIIANVLYNLVSVFVRLERVGAHLFQGRLLPIDARYMEIRSDDTSIQRPGKRGTKWAIYDELLHYDVQLPDNDGFALFNNHAYCLLLQMFIPTVRKHYRWLNNEQSMELYLIDEADAGSAICVREDHLTVYGNGTQLVTCVLESLDLYRQQHNPNITDYELYIEDKQATLAINKHSFPMALVSN